MNLKRIFLNKSAKKFDTADADVVILNYWILGNRVNDFCKTSWKQETQCPKIESPLFLVHLYTHINGISVF